MKLKNKKICVTGGAGFIGHHLVGKLLNMGNEVLVLDNLSFGKKEFLPNDKNLTFSNIDIRDSQKVKNDITKFEPEILMHLAAIHHIPYCNSHPFEASDININGMRNILRSVKENDIRRLFFSSTMAVYPINDIANKEASPVGPTDIYGTTKLVGEDLCELLSLKTGITAICGRLANVYGPEETNSHVIPEIENQVKEGKREIELGNIEPKRDFVHVYDVAGAMISLMESDIEGFDVFNIGTGKEYSIKETVEIFEKIIGEKLNIIQAEDRIRKAERMHLTPDIGKITESADWSPKVDFPEGIKGLF
jgi:UDP-glucose 4-epimerase